MQAQLQRILPTLFGELDEGAFQTLLPYFEVRVLLGGEVLFEQGERGRDLYILVSGRLQAVVRQ
ncbi:MAG: hypothetical protein D6765_07290, partial [Bacteroidetes bacterium]